MSGEPYPPNIGGARITTEGTAGIRKSNRRWQSDVIVDLIKRYDFPYVAPNRGASFRGLHDSLVNYGENDPPMLLCNHEKIAVQIAHGYARAKGLPSPWPTKAAAGWSSISSPTAT
jgi:hypothetical protein